MINKKKMILKNLLVFTIILSVIGPSFFVIEKFVNAQAEQPNTIEEVVDKYIANMKGENFAGVIDMITSQDFGYDAKVHNYEITNNYSNNPSAYNKLRTNSTLALLESQYAFVKEKFGIDAWEKVTVEIVKSNCPEKREEYINAETGKVISKEEYTTIADNYWKKFAEDRGILYSDFLDFKEYSGEYIKKGSMNILDAKEQGYEPPLLINLIDVYDFYIVYLSFNGKDGTLNGENAFSIGIDNDTGNFGICYGIRWFVPLSEENGAGD